METNLLSTFKRAVKNWWISLIVGILVLILGVLCMFTPLTTFVGLSIIFVISFFIGGISEIVFAVTNREVMRNWVWTLTMGIIDLIFALVLIFNMMLAPIVLCYLIAFWILLQSIWGIGIALDLQSIKGSGWGWLLALSILGIMASITLLLEPPVAGLFAVYIVSFGLIAYGIFRIYLGFRLKTMHKYLPEDKD